MIDIFSILIATAMETLHLKRQREFWLSKARKSYLYFSVFHFERHRKLKAGEELKAADGEDKGYIREEEFVQLLKRLRTRYEEKVTQRISFAL